MLPRTHLVSPPQAELHLSLHSQQPPPHLSCVSISLHQPPLHQPPCCLHLLWRLAPCTALQHLLRCCCSLGHMPAAPLAPGNLQVIASSVRGAPAACTPCLIWSLATGTCQQDLCARLGLQTIFETVQLLSSHKCPCSLSPRAAYDSCFACFMCSILAGTSMQTRCIQGAVPCTVHVCTGLCFLCCWPAAEIWAA